MVGLDTHRTPSKCHRHPIELTIAKQYLEYTSRTSFKAEYRHRSQLPSDIMSKPELPDRAIPKCTEHVRISLPLQHVRSGQAVYLDSGPD
jgi:hypothetical protein